MQFYQVLTTYNLMGMSGKLSLNYINDSLSGPYNNVQEHTGYLQRKCKMFDNEATETQHDAWTTINKTKALKSKNLTIWPTLQGNPILKCAATEGSDQPQGVQYILFLWGEGGWSWVAGQHY